MRRATQVFDTGSLPQVNRPGPIRTIGNYLCRRQLQVLHNAYLALCKDLDLPQWYADYFHKRALSEGISFYTKVLPLLGKATVEGLESGIFCAPTHFGYMRRTKIPIICGSLLLRVFDRSGQLRADADPNAVRSIRVLSEYSYKLDVDYTKQQSQTVIDRFVVNEESLSNIEFDFDNDPILQMANVVTKNVFNSYNEPDVFKHGPGVTSNVDLKSKLNYKLSPDLPVYERFAKEFFLSANEAFDSLERFPTRNTFSLFNKGKVKSRVILVPKDSRGPRLISCEPCENQYVQQGIMSWIVNHLENHPLTSGHVNFTDQGVNQQIAEMASVNRDYATLDLKDASDLVSVNLVSCIFSSTNILTDLLLSRTPSTVLPDGSEIKMSKFAPMGSALCFPIMAYSIFVLLYVSLIGIGVMPREAASSIYVYGDDIIIPSQYFDYCVAILERYGLIVNRTKSFVKGHFRESCGGDFFKGVNVVPVRLRKIRYKGSKRASRRCLAAHYVSHAQSCYEKRLFQTSEYFYCLAEEILGPLPYGTSQAGYLCRVADSYDEALVLNSNVINDESGIPKLIAYGIQSLTTEVPMSGWGHLRRVLGLLGKDIVLPKYGFLTLPRSWKVTKRKFFLN